jgi:hypothetical protein
MPTKDEIARNLAQAHFRVEDGLEQVVIIDSGSDPREPIKLLEVNANTLPTGSIEPFSFSSTSEIPFVTHVAEITPDEYARLQRGELSLPEGWSLEHAVFLPRPRAA